MTNKTRQDFGITYDLEVLRLMDIFRKHDLVDQQRGGDAL